MFLARFQLASRTSLLPFSLFMGPVLKFHSVGTSLMRKFDLYFSKRWSFLFPGTRLTQRRLSESYSKNPSEDFLHRVSPGLVRLFEKPMLPSLARHSPIVVQFSQ